MSSPSGRAVCARYSTRRMPADAPCARRCAAAPYLPLSLSLLSVDSAAAGARLVAVQPAVLCEEEAHAQQEEGGLALTIARGKPSLPPSSAREHTEHGSMNSPGEASLQAALHRVCAHTQARRCLKDASDRMGGAKYRTAQNRRACGLRVELRSLVLLVTLISRVKKSRQDGRPGSTRSAGCTTVVQCYNHT